MSHTSPLRCARKALAGLVLIAVPLLIGTICPPARADDFSAPLISIPVTPNIAISASATSKVTLQTQSRHIMLKPDACGTTGVVFFDLRGAVHSSVDSKTYNLRLLQGERFEAFYQVLTIGVSPASAAVGSVAATCVLTLQAGR